MRFQILGLTLVFCNATQAFPCGRSSTDVVPSDIRFKEHESPNPNITLDHLKRKSALIAGEVVQITQTCTPEACTPKTYTPEAGSTPKNTFSDHEAHRIASAYLLQDKGNSIDSMRYLRRVVKQNTPHLHYMLGVMYEKGMGLECSDYVNARVHYTLAANLGHHGSATRLGLMTAMGRDVAQPHYALALETFQKGIAQGDAESYVYLGEMYEKGLGDTKNLRTAIRYYRQAERMGSADATVNLALLMINGKGFTKNIEIAAQRLDAAALQGSAKAAFTLHTSVDPSSTSLKKSNPVLTAEFIKQAYRGNPYAQVFMYWAANYGYLGMTKGIQDTQKGINPYVHFLEMAARQDFPTAQMLLGSLYEDGEHGYERNLAKAITLYKLASQKGEAVALVRLGILYESGLGVTRNIHQARIHYTASLDLGNFAAQDHLDRLFETHPFQYTLHSPQQFHTLSAGQHLQGTHSNLDSFEVSRGTFGF